MRKQNVSMRASCAVSPANDIIRASSNGPLLQFGALPVRRCYVPAVAVLVQNLRSSG